jgi:hypothetical protein
MLMAAVKLEGGPTMMLRSGTAAVEYAIDFIHNISRTRSCWLHSHAKSSRRHRNEEAVKFPTAESRGKLEVSHCNAGFLNGFAILRKTFQLHVCVQTQENRILANFRTSHSARKSVEISTLANFLICKF